MSVQELSGNKPLSPIEEIEMNARDVITRALGSDAIDAATRDTTNSLLLVATEIAAERLANSIPDPVTEDLTELSAAFAVSMRIVDATNNKAGTFKVRGADYKIRRLGDQGRNGRKIAASAGNHAQGVALAVSRSEGDGAIIVMPETAPNTKYDATCRLGGTAVQVIKEGEDFTAASDYADQLLQKNPDMTLVHPYDDPDVMLGQATLGPAIIRDNPGMTHLFLPIGGGGLAGGLAAYVKAKKPGVLIFGVEPRGSACGFAAREAGAPVLLDSVDRFADGLAVRKIGRLPHALIARHVDHIGLVSNEQIGNAVLDLNEHGLHSEPSGAVGLAYMKEYARQHHLADSDACMVTVCTGKNVDDERYDMIIDEARERRTTNAANPT